MRIKLAAAALFLAPLLIGCSAGEQSTSSDDDTTSQIWVNKKPLLHAASPGAMAVGEDLVILGQSFIEKDRGRPFVRFTGTYVETSGASQPVDFQAQPNFVNGGKISWQLWPQITFSPTGDQLGRFTGTIIVTNKANDGSEVSSDPLPLSIDIKPSIIARKVTPLDAGCSPVITDTLEDQPMELTAEVIGLREATADAPLVFHWTFLAEQWKVSFNWGMTNPASQLPQKGAISLEDRVTSGRVSSISSRSPTLFLMQAVEDALGDGRLKELKTGILPEEGNNMPVTVNLAVTDGEGKQASVAIKLTVHRQADISYDGNSQIAERFAPVPVTDCMNGGTFGTDVSYHESTSESHERSVGVNWNVGNRTSIGLGIVSFDFSSGFGVHANETASSSASSSLSLNGHIFPGQWAVFYRQTSRIQRVGKLLGYNVCGQSYGLGEAIMTDWTFTPDLATGSACPPRSRLKPPEKLLD